MSGPVTHIPVVVVGAGHAGLAVSHLLDQSSVDHLVLERGEVANTWRKERWDSLRLLTPNWQTRLPGFEYKGDDPDGFMAVDEVVSFIDDYATRIGAPIETGTTVQSLRRDGDEYRLVTDRGTWTADSVVLATGGFNLAKLPPVATDAPEGIVSLAARDYKRPSQLPEGRALVVGASATGIQLANELHDSGRDITISVGEHVRLPRTYRGRDIQFWLDRIGRLDERYDEVDDIVRARHVPSPQLVGTPDRSTLDLNALTSKGVRLVGRISAFSGDKAYFSGSLRNVCSLADLKMVRLLDLVDEWVAESGLDDDLPPPERFPGTVVPDEPPLEARLGAEGFTSIVWATGYKPDYSWLDIDVLDRKGEIKHDGGVVTSSPGLYRIGLNFLRRRKSSFIHGAEDDAIDITDHLVGFLRRAGKV